MSALDLTLGTVSGVNTNRYTSITATTLTVTGLARTEDVRLGFDYGVGGINTASLIGVFVLDFDFKYSNFSAAGAVATGTLIGDTSANYTDYDFSTTYNGILSTANNPSSTTTYNNYVYDCNNGVVTFGTGISGLLVAGTQYYARDDLIAGGSFGIYRRRVYSNASRTTLVGTTQVNLTKNHSLRYLFPHTSNHNPTGAATYNAVFSNFSVVGLPFLAFRSEPLTLVDAQGASKIAVASVGESLTLSELAGSYGIKNKALSESTTLAESIACAIFTTGSASILETLSLSDTISKNRIAVAGVVESTVFTSTFSSTVSAAPATSRRSWRITKWDTATSKIVPVTGLAPMYSLFRPSDGLTLDLADGTFKAYASCTTPKAAMTARDATNYPGWYDYVLPSGAFNLTGIYQENAEVYGTDNYFAEVPVAFLAGVEQIGGMTAAQDAVLASIPTASENATAVWAKAVEGLTAEEMMRVMLAGMAGKRSGLGTGTEQYFGRDGVTPRITLTPTDANGNGTPIINGAA